LPRQPAGADEQFGGIVGSAGFKLFDLEVARTGLGAAEIAGAGLDAVSAVSQHHTRARSYPGDITSHQGCCMPSAQWTVAGAQMIGADAVAKRIDVFALRCMHA